MTSTVPSSTDGRPAAVTRWTRSPRVVSRARSELRRELDGWGLGALADTAELVLSELLSNAVQYAPSGREIETRYEPTPDGGVRIEVHDAGDRRPRMPEGFEGQWDKESGRGLALVNALTGARCGVSDREGVGKRVWAVVGLDAHAEPEVPIS